MSHVTDEEIGRFLSGGLEKREYLRVLRHLVSQCSPCQERLGLYAPVLFSSSAPPPASQPPEDTTYDEVINRVLARALAVAPRWHEERRQIGVAAERLRKNPRAEVDDLAHWSLVEALIRLSQEARYNDPGEMYELAFLAEFASRHLDPERYSPGQVADLRIRALAELANARRVNEDLDGAEEAFAKAALLSDRRSGDPLVMARVLDLLASLRRTQRQLAEAIDLLDTVHGLYKECGESHLAGRALISEGICTHYDGRPQDAVKLLRKGISMLEPGLDPQLDISSQENLLYSLVDSGKLREARRLLLESGLRQKLADEPVNLLKLRWVEGKISAGQGNLDQAVATFEEVREGFLQRGMEYDAALLGLELMEVWLRQGRNAEVREMAEEVLDTFEELKVKLEAQRAVRFLEAACRQELATPVLVQKVVSFLRRLEWTPGLQFAP
ncbi:MAG TPA: tetratricopeptide repeat protein [Thermoanaerobaculia bacterium]|nr:tetratricopeptide repeat protein [Thermoanaerobaculia bacterium]